MKGLKIFAIVLAGLVALAVLLVGLAFLSPVQTWAVRRAVAGQPGLTVEVGRVAAGLSRAEIADLRVVKDGLVITAKAVSVHYSAWDYLAHKRVNVDEVVLQGLAVDARHYAPAAAHAAAPATAPTTTLAVDGSALLPGERALDFTLSGGGIEVGQRGQLSWKIDFTDPQKDAPLRALHTTGALVLHLAADRRIDAVEIDNTIAAEGPNLPGDRIQLTAQATQPAAGANETYTARVALVHAEKAETVLNANVDYQAAARTFAGTWNVALRGEQVVALLAGLGLPDVAVDGAGRFTFQPDTQAAAASGEINGRVSRLERFAVPAVGQVNWLAAVGTLQLHAAFDGSFAANVARLSRLEFEVSTAEGRKLLQVAAAQPVSFDIADQKLTLAKPDAELARISLQSLPLAWAQPVVKPVTIAGGDLSVTLAIEAEPDGSRARVRTVQPLTLHAVTVRDGDRTLVDRMDLSLSPRLDYSATGITAEVPDLKLALPAGDSVNGKITAAVTGLPAAPVVAFSAQFQERLVNVLKPYLPLDPGPLAVDSAVAGQLDVKNQVLQLAKFSTTAKRDNGSLLAAVETLQPLTVNLAAVRVAAADAAAPAARVSLGEVPLAWGEAFVPKSKFAGTLTGGAFEVTLRSRDDLTVQVTAPVTLRGIGVTLDGQALAQALDVDVDFSATKRAEAVSGELRRLEVKQGAASLLRLSATGEAKLGAKPAASGKGKLEADVAALLRQPALAPFATIARGNVTMNFDATLADTLQAKATVAVRNLVAKQRNQTLGDLDLSVDAALKSDGSGGTVKLPVTLASGNRKSDLLLDGNFSRTATTLTFNGKLTSNQIVADDFQAFAVLAPQSPASSASQSAAAQRSATPAPAPTANRTAASASPTAATSPTTAPAASAPAHDTAPFWQGVAGRFEADLKKIQYGTDYTVTGLKCAAVIDDTRLALDNLEGKVKDNAFKVNGGIAFAAKQAQPYTLTGLVNIPGFDVGAFLRAANPNEPPALETKVTIAAKLAGHGATLPDLLQNATGQFDVTGTSGVLRALGKKGQVAGAASTVLGVLGALKGSDTTSAVGQFAGELKEMKFDKFTMHVERGVDLNLKLNSLEFISPVTRLSGSGNIQYQKGVEIANQPLHVELTLGGKEHMAVLLNKLNLLGGQQDDKGYYLMSQSFLISGTPSNPDSSQLWKIVGEAGLKSAAGLIFGR